MKRIHFFEFEDLPWFPDWIRRCMTAYLKSLHRTLGTAEIIAPLVNRGLRVSNNRIVDLCSGAGGPMIDVVESLRSQPAHSGLSLVLTDLYPNGEVVERINSSRNNWMRYETTPIDAASVPNELKGLRTMICSFHHMRPKVATKILQDAVEKKQPLLAFEISDNSLPLWLGFLSIPIGFLLSLVMTLRVRPLTLKQVVFTYCVPIIPLFVAWDAAVSNARTYTKNDLRELLTQFESVNFDWEIEAVKVPGLPMAMLYILGMPRSY